MYLLSDFMNARMKDFILCAVGCEHIFVQGTSVKIINNTQYCSIIQYSSISPCFSIASTNIYTDKTLVLFTPNRISSL